MSLNITAAEVAALTPDTIASILDAVKKVSTFAKAFAKFTPTTYDDKALEAIDQLVAIVENLTNQPWFAGFMVYVLSLVAKANG